MKIHAKLMVLITLMAFLSLSGFLFYEIRASQYQSRLMEIEREEEAQSLSRILANQQKQVENVLLDYAYWNEIVEYAEGRRGKEWEAQELDHFTHNYGFDAIWIFKRDGSLRYSHRAYSDFPSEQFQPTKEELESLFGTNSTAHFFQWTEEGLIEIYGAGLHRLNDLSKDTAAHGYFFIAKAWNEDYIRLISSLTGGKVRIASLLAGRIKNAKKNNYEIKVYQNINGIDGKPFQRIELTLDKSLFFAKSKNIKDVAVIALISFVGISLILFYLLYRWISKPIRLLSEALEKNSPSLVETLVARKDEYGDLARLVSEFFTQRDRLIQENQYRREAETTLNWKNEFQQCLLDTVPIPMFYTDDAGFYLGCNKAYEKFSGIPRYVLIGKSIHDVYSAATCAQIEENNEKLLLTGGENRYEGPITLKDGTTRDVISMKAAYLNKKGEIAGIVGTYQDITEIRKMERAIQKNETRLRTLLEASMDAVFLVSFEGNIIDCNTAATQIYGFSRQEISTMNFYQEFGEGLGFSQLVREIGNGTRYIETESKRKNGEIFPCEIRTQLATLEGDDVLAIYIRDVTLQKKIREQILAQRDIALSIAAASSINDSLPKCVKTTIELSGMDSGGIYLLEPKTGNMVLAAWDGLSVEFIEETHIFKQGHPLYQKVFAKKPIYLSVNDAAFKNFSPAVKEEGIKCLGVVPLLRQNEVIGCFNLASHTLEEFPDEARNILETIAAQLAGAISRIQAQEELNLSEINYRTIFNASHDAILLLDKETGIILDINQSGLALFDLHLADARRMTINDLGSFDVNNSNMNALEWLFHATQEHRQVFEWKLLRPNRSPLWIEVTLKQTIVQGKECILAVMRDVSERKASEEALRETNEILNALIQASPAAIVAIDREGVVRQWNPAARNIFGWSAEEIVGKPNPIMSKEELEKHHIFDPKFVMESSRGIELKTKRKDARNIEISLHSAPLSDASGEVAGMMAVIEDITERKIAERQLQHAAFYDTLTGLPNRPFFMDRLHYCLTRSKRSKDFLFAVLFLDLDRFKEINDTLGHMVGDQILVQVSHRLRRCIRETDLLARLGGDEFTILMEDLRYPMDATRLAERILKELSAPYTWQDREIYTTASIGIALSKKDEGTYETAEDILRDSDTAMYQAKGKGRERYEIFDQAMHESIKSIVEMETELRRALEHKELRLFYQPIIHLKSQKIFGFEALLYWQHPTRGLVEPNSFIPVAEETGLIIPIGEWVLLEASRQIMAWKNKYKDYWNLTMGVNISSRQFEQIGFVARVKNILEETGMDPHYLNIEITESAILAEKHRILPVIKALKEMGIKIHMDDFGMGYSSLNYQLCFPIDRVKIGQDFLINMGRIGRNKEMVHSIINLAQALNVEVIAEGVETINHLKFLEGENCELGQGFLFAKPLSSADAENYLANEGN
jgi:diguanylate cyclase (GGDEF)-like protein/PAS domain S-box-containing protein